MAAVASRPERTGVNVVFLVTRDALGFRVVKGRTGVTRSAGEIGVCPDERKARDVMIEPGTAGPVRCHVTAVALCAELALVHILVASLAVAWQGVVYIPRVACITGQFVVPRGQCERGARRVIEDHRTPVGNVMAGAAAVPVAAFVYVIVTMTGNTFRVVPVAEIVGSVTILASEATVAARQRKPGLCEMVEHDGFPGTGAMTIHAFGAVSSFVHVILLVTRHAGIAHVAERRRFMAVPTADVGMGTCEWERRPAVVEEGFSPVSSTVTGNTVVTELAHVRVVLPVAADTGGGRLLMRPALRVALAARDVVVSTLQLEIRQVMIERRFVQCHDVDVSAFVIGMAFGTLQHLRSREASVKAGVGRNVAPHVFVADDAKLKLRPVRQWIMAGIAVVFDVCVTRDDGPRHDQPLLQRGSAGRRNIEQRREHYDKRDRQEINSAIAFLHQYK